MIKEAWFRRHRPKERPPSFAQVVQSWDTANKPSELADYSVCTTWGVKRPHFYLLNTPRKKLDFPNLKRAARTGRSLRSDDHPGRGQGVRDATDPGPHRRRPFSRHSLQARRRQDHALHAQTAIIENGFVHLPETAHWLADYLHELTMFPAGRYDDQVDSAAQALAWTKIRPPGWGWSEYCREQLERAKGTVSERLVSLKALVALKSFARALRPAVHGSRWRCRRGRRRRVALPPRQIFAGEKGTRHAHEIPDFVDSYAPDGHRFKSPQLHQEVLTNSGGFRIFGNRRHFNGLAGLNAVCARDFFRLRAADTASAK
jgi:hypothetical protein